MLLLILLIVAVSAVVRLVTFPFRIGRRFPPFYGYRGYGGYGNPYGYGYGRHGGIGRLFLVLFVLYAVSHLFGHHHHHHFL